MPCDDCSRTESCPPCPNEEPEKCPHVGSRVTGGDIFPHRTHFKCDTCGAEWTRTGEDLGVPSKCVCGHTRGQHSPALFGVCQESPCACLRWRLEQPEEPPLTPEEEEEAPKDVQPAEDCVCGHTEPEHDAKGTCWNDLDGECECPAYRTKPDFELPPDPPQPERRPPLLVAYAVQGHLYEVAVSGDAVARAVDGALVITHPLGPIAGICQVAPMKNEESA